MARRKPQPRKAAVRAAALAATAEPLEPADPLRPWLLAVAVALFVARPLMPSEAAALAGDGMPVVLLWIVLAVGWAVGMVRRPRPVIRWNRFDTAVALLVSLMVVAALAALFAAGRRPVLNMLWEWIGLGLLYFALRQLLRSAAELRAVVVVVMALGVSLAAYGLYQGFVEMPQARALFDADPEAALREAGLNLAPGSPERQRFVDRLNNRMPLGSFALTNSLAAFLVVPLVLGATILLDLVRRGPGWRRTAWMLGGCLAPIGLTLALTRSRSGCIAAAVGVLLAWWTQRRRAGTCRFSGEPTPLSERPQTEDSARSASPAGRPRWLLATVGIVIVAAGVWAFSAGGRQKLQTAAQSLAYRTQYWRATARMIGDHPWLGVGPGNFQDFYTRYKLPEASEEVADPHNFLLEVAATAGIPAALVLTGIFVVFLAWSWRQRDVANDEHKPAIETRQTFHQPLVVAGALGGLSLAPGLWYSSAAPPGRMLLALAFPIVLLVFWLLNSWIARGRLPTAAPAVSLVAALIALSTSGGIAFPSVAGNLWLLLALGLNGPGAAEAVENSPVAQRSLPQWGAYAALIAGLGLALVCYATAYSPVLRAQRDMRLAVEEPRLTQRFLEAALANDPFDARPAEQLAGLAAQQYLATQDPAALQEFEKARSAALRTSGEAAGTWALLGTLYQKIHQKTGRPEFAQAAVRDLQVAVTLYPTHATYHALLALAWQSAGQPARAARAAATALDLDQRTPHADRRLSAELRHQMQRLRIESQ